MSTSNRVALFEGEPARGAALSAPSLSRDPRSRGVLLGAVPPVRFMLDDRSPEDIHATPSLAGKPPVAHASAPDSPVWASTEAGLKDTMIHEATHQVAFNTGLHSRLGCNPKWVVEGL